MQIKSYRRISLVELVFMVVIFCNGAIAGEKYVQKSLSCNQQLGKKSVAVYEPLFTPQKGREIFQRALEFSLLPDLEEGRGRRWTHSRGESFKKKFPHLEEVANFTDQVVEEVKALLSNEFPRERVQLAQASLRLENAGNDTLVHRDDIRHEYFTVSITFFGRGTRLFADKERRSTSEKAIDYQFLYEALPGEVAIFSGDARMGKLVGTPHGVPEGERLVLILNFEKINFFESLQNRLGYN